MPFGGARPSPLSDVHVILTCLGTLFQVRPRSLCMTSVFEPCREFWHRGSHPSIVQMVSCHTTAIYMHVVQQSQACRIITCISWLFFQPGHCPTAYDCIVYIPPPHRVCISTYLAALGTYLWDRPFMHRGAWAVNYSCVTVILSSMQTKQHI